MRASNKRLSGRPRPDVSRKVIQWSDKHRLNWVSGRRAGRVVFRSQRAQPVDVAGYAMTVYRLDPLQDGRWGEFIERHPRASIFHSPGWLEALRRAYGYEPVVYTTTPPKSELRDGLVACRVNSWLTGRRLVSVPFADHCDLLVEEAEDRRELVEHVQGVVQSEGLGYIEMRPPTLESWPDVLFAPSQTFTFHMLDLGPCVNELFSRFHKDGIQRKIRRAERDGLQHEEGRSDLLIRSFFRLLMLTRRRHQVPPQPPRWFQHLRACLGDRLNIRVALKDGRPIASILTLCYKDTLFYKYGGSDAAHHNTGAMPFLLWKAIQDARKRGLRALDLGRSDSDNAGLVTFKQRWGATSSMLTYLRYPATACRKPRSGYAVKIARGLVPLLPDAVLVGAGKLFYRHVG